MPRTRTAYPVRVIFTGSNWMSAGPLLTDATGLRTTASSATAARKACRAAGYRVMVTYGFTELAEEHGAPCPATGERSLCPVWHVTVHSDWN